jgi:hypothetical protein
VGVLLPVAHSAAVAPDALAGEPTLAVTRLGAGVVLHTRLKIDKQRPVALGYADSRDPLCRDGRMHVEAAAGCPKAQEREIG